MTADVELLPCPFCGGTEIYIGPMTPSSAWEYWTVGCNNDDCPLDADSVKVEMGTLEKAAAAWNTRATDANLAPLQAENERLRAEVREAREFRDKMANAIGNDQLRRFIEKHGEPVPLTIRMQQAEARADKLRAEVERLRADRDSWEQQASDRVADWHAEHLRAERLADALREVMLWIENWSPPFTEDDEWPDTEAKAQAALHPTAAQENNDA